jgi:hypothetical protein
MYLLALSQHLLVESKEPRRHPPMPRPASLSLLQATGAKPMDLPNWISTPHLRRVLQRMQADYTSIFGGRDRELAELDAWLTDEERPYALLLAPTGRGKTALVWHWLARQQHEWQVIFVPVSIRYSNSSQADVFAALTHAFAHMHGEQEDFNALQHSANELRPKLAAYLRRELPDNTRVLLAIDGLDEATGWELGADLLPENPPANLKILLSARDMAQHQRADWYHKLGLQSEQTHDFTLGGLDRIALKELLIALGTPLDELAADFDILGEFLRVSAGDPVIVRLLVQLLREERIQIGQISQLPADDLNAVFALWLNQLSAQQSQIAQILLLLFANAYGPLSARDLLGLAPDHFADTEQIAHAITPLARFVIGDAESGYVFSHQKLRELYRDRLDAQTLAEWNARFVEYGKQAYREPTPYLCRFLVNHLRDAGEWQFIRDLLADFSPQQAWAEARYALEGSYNGYLRDLEVLQTWSVEQQDLVLCSHCSLINSSIRNISSNLSGKLLVALINIGTTRGKWSVEAVMAHIEQQTSTFSQMHDLVSLLEAGIIVPWERALDLIKQAEANTVQLDAYFALYPLIPTEFQAVILENIYQFITELKFFRVSQLLSFLPQLTFKWQERFINYIFQAQNIYREHNFPNWQQIFDNTPADWQAQMRQFIQSKLQATEKLNIRDFINNIALLPQHQQQLTYWGLSPHLLLTSDITRSQIDLLPEQELHETLEAALRVKINPNQLRLYNAHSFLLLYTHYFPQHPQLLDTAVEILSHYIWPLERSVLELLPAIHKEQLAKQLIELGLNWGKLPMFVATGRWQQQYVDLLDFVSDLRPQLIELLIKMDHQLDVLAYLPLDQQKQQIEQKYLKERLIKDQRSQVGLKTRLFQYQPKPEFLKNTQELLPLIPQFHLTLELESLLQAAPELSDAIYEYLLSLKQLKSDTSRLLPWFTQQQQTILAQTIFQHAYQQGTHVPQEIYPSISPEQQQQALAQLEQKDTFDNKFTILGLISIPDFPHHKLVPYIHKIRNAKDRLACLAKVLPRLPEAEQTALLPSIASTLQKAKTQTTVWDYTLPPTILDMVLDDFAQHGSATLDFLLQIYFKQNPSEQQIISKALYDYVKHNPHYSLENLIKNRQLFYCCLPNFDQAQINTAFELALSQHNKQSQQTLIPYLNAQQLKQLHQYITQQPFKEGIEFYLALQEKHQILDQAEYYQSLLAYIQTHQTKITTLEYHAFEQLTSYLPDQDAQLLFHTYVKLNNKATLNQYITNYFQRTGYLSQQRIMELISYASQKTRAENFALQKLLLPVYIETLDFDQQQAFIAQINHSIDQIVNCWP